MSGDLPGPGLGLHVATRGEGAAERRARSWSRLLDDLRTLGAELLDDLATVDEPAGAVGSLCAGWSVRDVVLHLAVGDDLARRALGGEDLFPGAGDDEVVLARESNARVAACGDVPIDRAVAWFRTERERLLGALAEVGPEDRSGRVPWAAKPITRFALAQSRVMETWVHGWDLRQPLGVPQTFDDRAWWLTDLAVRHVGYGFRKSGLPMPAATIRFALTGPAGGSWERPLVGPTPDPERGEDPEGDAARAISVAGPAWAWAVLTSRRRPGRDEARRALTVAPRVAAADLLETARAFA